MKKKWCGVAACLVLIGLCIGGIVQSQLKSEAKEMEFVVRAHGDGKIIFINEDDNFYWGKTIIIGYKDGYATVYHHLDEILVKIEQVVKEEDNIGKRVLTSYGLSNTMV